MSGEIIDNIIKLKELEKLPIFHMSLSSKELFHSNFLGWILENYQEEMVIFFESELRCKFTTREIKNIQREKKNIDLSFTIGDTLFLIENKVKSIAYKEQLDKYSQLDKKIFTNDDVVKIKYILLSLQEPEFINTNKEYQSPNGYIWRYIGYTNLVAGLRKIANFENEYHRHLIEDYIQFIKILNENIMQQVPQANVLNMYQKGTPDYEFLQKLTEIRMHDFFQKAVFENFANDICKELIKQRGTYKELKEIKSGMTRGTGLINIFFEYDSDVSMGIQIQGGQYRKFINGTSEEDIFELSTKLKNKSFFAFQFFGGKEVRPSNPNKKLQKLAENLGIANVDCAFNKYHWPLKKQLFLYKYITPKEVLSNADYINIICDDLKEMISLISEIKKDE